GFHGESDALIVFWIRLPEGAGNPLQVCACGIYFHASGQASDHIEFPTAAIGIRTICERHVDLLADPGFSRREDADNGVSLIVQAQRLPKNPGASSEPVLPEAIAENRDAAVGSTAALFVGEVAPQNGRYSKSAKETSRGRDGPHLLRR